MKKLTIIAVVFVTSGCATYKWASNGTLAEFRRDYYECERDMRQVMYNWGDSFMAPTLAAEFGERCMISKGYQKVRVD